MGRPKKELRQNEGPATIRAVIYARVSTKEQEEGFSIDAQLALLRGYAMGRGMVISGEFVEAETAKVAGRSQFGRMVKALAAGEATAIVVEKTDRIYRNLKDRVTIDELGVELHLVKENTVLSKNSRSHEKFVHDIKVVVAKNYIDNLSEEASKGMREKAKQGFWPSFAPVGYRNVSRGTQKLIEPDPEYAPLIARLFAMYATGDYSLKRAGLVAKSLGLKTRRGLNIQTGTIYLILQNPIYIGLIRWGGEVYQGKHQPIIDCGTFNQVQNVLSGRLVKTEGPKKADFAYRGLIRCGKCGCLMSPYLAKGTYIYYACTGYKGCDRRGIREDLITDQIAAELEGLTIKPEVMEMLRQALKESLREQKAEHTQRLALLRTEYDRLTSALEQLYADKLTGDVPASAYPKLKTRWEAELFEVSAGIEICEKANRATWEDNVAMLELVSNSSRSFLSATAAERHAMLKNLVSNCSILDRKLALELRPWFKLVLDANARTPANAPKEEQMENWWAQRDSNL